MILIWSYSWSTFSSASGCFIEAFIKGQSCNSSKKSNFISHYHFIRIWSASSWIQVFPYPILVLLFKALLFQLEFDITFERAFMTVGGIEPSWKAAGTFMCSSCPLGLKSSSDFSLLLLRCRNILGKCNQTNIRAVLTVLFSLLILGYHTRKRNCTVKLMWILKSGKYRCWITAVFHLNSVMWNCI